MNNTKQFMMVGLLSLTSLLTHAQQTLDLSTGRSNTTGAQLHWPDTDDTWLLRRPGTTTFLPVKVGTGYLPASDIRYLDLFTNVSKTSSSLCNMFNDDPIGWLTPDPVATTATLLGIEYNAGDVSEVSPAGTYTYRAKFIITPPSCKKLAPTAYLVVKKLTGVNRVTKIRINGQQSNISTYSGLSQYPYQAPYQEAHYFLGALSTMNQTLPPHNNLPICTWYGSPGAPIQYIIPLNTVANFNQISGINYLEIDCEVDTISPTNKNITGFLCSAELQYDFIDAPAKRPQVDFSGTPLYACLGDSPAVQFKISNPGSDSYDATLYSSTTPAPATPVYSFLSAATLTTSATSVSVSVPMVDTKYKVTVVNNTTGCTGFAETVMRKCHYISPIHIEINDPSRHKFGVNATPTDPDEAVEPGFISEWYLEELNMSTGEPILTVANPSCWASKSGNTFKGFNSESYDIYKELAAEDIPDFICAAADETMLDGIFATDHLYRITRLSQKTGGDWIEYSELIMVEDAAAFEKTGKVTVTPTASPERADLIKRSSTNANVSADLISVYPNPGTGLFVIKAVQTGTMNIYDALGKNVKQAEIKGGSEQTVDLSGFAKGLYTVNITTAKGVKTQKLILE